MIICGDFNFPCNEHNLGYRSLLNIMTDFNLSHCDDLICNNVHESYVNVALGHSSLIDHFIVSARLKQLITNCEILVPPNNFSDHRPVCVNVNLPNVSGSFDEVTPGSRPVRLDHFRWDKANLMGYYEQSRLFLADVRVDNNCLSCQGNCSDGWNK